jgi:heme-degrading monooxygenase HmoA
MITIGMNYEVLEGKTQPFEKKFAQVLEAMDGSEGHVRTQLYKDVFKERSYLVVSEWNSRPAFDSFIGSAAFKKVTDWGTANILAGRPAHREYGSSANVGHGASDGAT